MTDTDELVGLPTAAAFELEVAGREQLTPGTIRLHLTSPDLAGFAHVAGQDLMLAVPHDDGTINRRYTIRRHDPGARTVDIDAVVHGDGPGARWFASAASGERIAAYGPRGKIVASPSAAWHLFVADESGLPATAAMLEALPEGSTAVAVIEVADAREEQPIDLLDGATVTWVHRDGAPAGSLELLRGAVGAVVLADGPGHAYLSAELSVVNALRGDLESRGLHRERISPKAYWRRGAANAAHGEPLRDGGARDGLGRTRGRG